MKSRFLLLGILGLALSPAPAWAQANWTGTSLSTDDWSDMTNWSGFSIPSTGADVILGLPGLWASSVVDYSVTLNSITFTNLTNFDLAGDGVHGLTINQGIYYGFPGNVQISTPIGGTGVLWLNGGTGTLTLTALTPNQNTYSGTTEVFAGGTLTDGAPNSFSASSYLYIGSAVPSFVQVNYNETIGGLGDVSGGPGNLNIAGSATLTIGGNYSNSYSGAITGNGTLDYASVGTLTLSGDSSFTGMLLIASGSTVQLGNGGTTGSLAANSVTGAGSLSFDRSDTGLIFGGSISGSVQVVQNGPGLTALAGTNSYTGSTVVNAGTLQAGSSTAFGGAAGQSAVLVNGGTLDLNSISNTVGSLAGSSLGAVLLGSATLTLGNNQSNTSFAGAIHGAGGLVVGNYIFDVTGANNDYSGGTTITAGTFLADNSAGSAVGNGPVQINSGGTLQLGNLDANGIIGAGLPITDNGSLTFAQGSGTTAFNNPITGTGQVLKFGNSTVALGAASYSGPTTVYAGTLTDSNPNGLSPNSDVTIQSGGTLVIAYDEVIGSLQYAISPGGVTIPAGVTLSSNGLDYVAGKDFSGMITGLGRYEVAGGVQGLSGSNLYSGGTLISGTGELFVGSSAALGSGTITFAGTAPEMSPDANVTLGNNIVLNANFDNDDGGTNNLTLTGQISGPGQIVWCAPGTIALSGNNIFGGGVDMRQGNLLLLNNNGAGTGTISLNTTAVLTVGSGVTVANPINFIGTTSTLAGSGTIATPVTAGAGVIIAPSQAPGGGPGTLSFSNGLTLGNGSQITLSLYDASGAAGTGYSLVGVSGGLGLTATTGGITVDLVSINATGGSAAALNFSSAASYSWKLASSASAITGFSPTEFTFANNLLNATNGGSLSVSQTGNALYVDFTPVPEPSTWALIAGGTLIIAWTGLRHAPRAPTNPRRRQGKA